MTVSESQQTDEGLVQASLAGSRESFVSLVRRYQHLVYGLCLNMLGNADDALDASQDAFIAAFRRLGELRQQADFRPWLRSIANNVCRHRLRLRRTTAELEECPIWVNPFDCVDESIDLNRALAGLSDENRLSVLLFYFEGNSVREIAQFLGIPETTVMSRLRNARSQLKRSLQTMFDTPTKRSSLPEDFADRIPIPYDEYGPISVGQYQPLSPWRAEWLLSAFPVGSTISAADIQGYDWEALPERDVQVVITTPSGTSESVVLRMSGRKDGTRIEAALLPLLAELGLPVPKVVAGPTQDPDYPDRGLLIATSVPGGRSACSWAVDGGIKAVERACEVVMEGIDWIISLTAGVESSPVAQLLERCSLADELTRVINIGGPWMTDPSFSTAIVRLGPIVEKIQVPLIFSDGGIGPNALVDEEGNLIGFASFAWARIEDPHYQITKCWTYDCWPIRRAGFVERYLVRNNLSMHEFAPRLAVRALVTLQREIPLRRGDEGYRNDMLGWLKLAMDNL